MKRKKPKSPKGFIIMSMLICVVAVSFPVLRGGMGAITPLLEQFTQKAALLSALFSMPEKSMEMLEERFNSEMFSPEEDPPEETPAPPPPPQSSSQEENGQNNTQVPPSKGKEEQPEIPKEYQGPVIEEFMGGGTSTLYVRKGDGIIKNSTSLTNAEVESILKKDTTLSLSDKKEPQVLIFHTHATESFEKYDSDIYDTRGTWRSTNNEENMVAVGDAMVRVLEEKGIGVIHDTTQHDYPSYNGAYNRSAETVKKYLEKYPSIKIVLDVHRDAVQRDKTLVKPVATINGKKAAQLMIISGCDDGTMNMPNWRENLRFAAALQSTIEENYKGLTRPVFFCYRKYNMDLSPGALLLEIGSHGNTLEETLYSAELIGDSLAKLIQNDLTK